MKSKQINKFLLMFFMSFTLFFSVSYAEFSSGVWLDVVTTATRNKHSETVIDNYTYAQIYNIVKNYYADQVTYKSSYDNLITAINNNNYDYVITHNYYTNDVYQIFIFKNLDVGHWVNSDNYLCFTGKNDGSNILMHPDNQNGYGEKLTDFSYVFGAKFLGTLSIEYSTVPIKELTRSSSQAFWDGSSYFYEISGTEEPDIPSMTGEEFSAMLGEITTSELFYQHIPSEYRNNFYVQYDTENEVYLFYFYPSNYSVTGLLRNENDYHIICDKDFSWWDNIVNFLKTTFVRETENLDYKMIYATVLEDGTYSCWYRSKSMLSVDETLFNFNLNPIVYASQQIQFYGQHGGGGINIDTGDVTLATEPEYIVNDEVYGESNIVYNPSPIETVSGEQSFWDKVVNRLSSIVSYVKEIPENIINRLFEMNGISVVLNIISPLAAAIISIIGIFGSVIALISRAVTFIYTLPKIEASRALFDVDVSSTEGLNFTGNNWGVKFLEGLDMIKNFSWNGLNLWNLFVAFVVAMFAIQAIKYVRKHYHY